MYVRAYIASTSCPRARAIRGVRSRLNHFDLSKTNEIFDWCFSFDFSFVSDLSSSSSLFSDLSFSFSLFSDLTSFSSSLFSDSALGLFFRVLLFLLLKL